MEAQKGLWCQPNHWEKQGKVFFVVSLKDYASYSSGLWRNLAAGFHSKETQGFGIPLGKLRSSRFLDPHGDRITMRTLRLMWDRRDLERSPWIYSHVLACYNTLFYFLLWWAWETSLLPIWWKPNQTKQPWMGLGGSLNLEKWPQNWLKTPTRMKNGTLQVPGRCCSDQLQTHFILHCY